MAFTPEELRHRARRAYEVGRVWSAMPWAIVFGGVGLLGTAVTGTGLLGIALSLLAASAAWLCIWYGRDLGRGVWPGLWVGSVALLLGLFAWACVGRGATGFIECKLPCVAAGFLIAFAAFQRMRSGSKPRQSMATLVGTVVTATPLALIACIGVGVGGLVGLAGGLIAGSAPVVIRALRAAG